ncbi:MAG: hypothetical protein ACP5OG_01450 [Candidatus Nanoarchaeia archaeon]
MQIEKQRDCDYYLKHKGKDGEIGDGNVFSYYFGMILCCDNDKCENNTRKLGFGDTYIDGDIEPTGVCLTNGYLRKGVFEEIVKENEEAKQKKELLGKLISDVIDIKSRNLFV